ncbi:MAG: hypothetical protein OEQ74_03700 [Gammaproteobacteria bacterium]|nr:hypothetical protein [Gammaproteobacteria bacterium]
MNYKTIMILASALSFVGCATDSSRLEDTYGDSVRSMIYNQIADPETAANPDPDPVLGYDGSKAENVLDTHNKNVTKAEQTTKDINLDIGK